jgi:hypothetical protein
MGGDDLGARILNQISGLMPQNETEIFFVVNVNRPETRNLEGLLRHISQIEKEIGLRITGLVNNSHMLLETTLEDVLRGQELCIQISDELRIPIRYTTWNENVLGKPSNRILENLEGMIFPIKLYMRDSWLDR